MIFQNLSHRRPIQPARRADVFQAALLAAAMALISTTTAADEFQLGSFTLSLGTAASADAEHSLESTIGQSTTPESADADFVLVGSLTGASFSVVPGLGPRLSIEPALGGVRISWEAPDGSFSLERSAQLSVPVWGAVEQTVEQDGAQFSITIPVTQEAQFFRLRQSPP